MNISDILNDAVEPLNNLRRCLPFKTYRKIRKFNKIYKFRYLGNKKCAFVAPLFCFPLMRHNIKKI